MDILQGWMKTKAQLLKLGFLVLKKFHLAILNDCHLNQCSLVCTVCGKFIALASLV